MPIVILIAVICVGFLLGYFFTTPVVIVLTIIAAIIAWVYRPKREQEIGALAGVVVLAVLGLGTAIMWIVHLYVTGEDLGLSEVLKYIIRQ